MGDIHLISVVLNDTKGQPTRTVSQTMPSDPAQTTGAAATMDDSFNFPEALDSPCVVTMSYFDQSLPRLPRRISPPIGRVSQPSAVSCLPQSHSSQSAHFSPCDCTKPSNGSVKTDSGFSSWTGTSETRKKTFFPAKPSESHMRSNLPFSPGLIGFGQDLHVAHSPMCSVPQHCGEDPSERSRDLNFGMLSCVHALDEEIADRMCMNRLRKTILHVPSRPSAHFSDGHPGSRHLPVTSSPVVHAPDSSLPPCFFVSYEPGDVKATGVVSPHWLVEPIVPDSPIPYPKMESTPNHSGGPIRDEDEPAHFQLERCVIDTDADGDDERELVEINQVSNIDSSSGCHLRSTYHCHSIRSHSPLLIRREDASRPDRHLGATNSCYHTVREPLWMRRSRPSESICLPPSLGHSGGRVETPPPISGTTDVTSSNSPSQCHHFQPSSIPDVVPRHLCSLRVPPVVTTALAHLTPLHCVSTGTYLQPRCSSVPLISSSHLCPVPQCTFGCSHFFPHRRRTNRTSNSFSMQSAGGVGVGSAPHRQYHLSILARRMADIGDELDADYHGLRRSTLATEHIHGTQSTQRVNDSLWSLSSSLASLVAVPFDCVHRIFQLAGRSLSGTSLQMPESPTQRTSHMHVPTRRRRTATFNSTGSGRHRYTAPHGQPSETVDVVTPNSRPPRTMPVHLPSRAREPHHHTPSSVPLDGCSSPQLRIVQESVGSRQTADEIFSFDH